MSTSLKPPSGSGINKLPEIVRPSSGNHNKSYRDEGQHEYSNQQISQQGLGMDLASSPFKLPTDEEVFLFRENQRQKKQEMKTTSADLKIWEKKTASNRTQLKHYKNFETKVDEKFVPKTKYNGKEKKLIQQALEIAKDRQKNRENGIIKEPIVNLIEQKKEMFLVTMAHGIIQNEILKLKQTSEDKKLALDQSLKMLETDQKKFEQYLETNKKQKQLAETLRDNEINAKKDREQEIKKMNIFLTSLRAEITRNEEAIANYKEHKDFLDKLAPKEWNDTKQRKRQEKFTELKDKYLQQQNEKKNLEEESDVHDKGNKRDRDFLIKQKKNQNDTKVDADKQMIKKLENEQWDELEEFDDDYEMFFKNPSQLVELFNDLEERNLFLIQTTQDAEQNLEELKTRFAKTKLELDTKIKNLFSTKDMLKNNYENVVLQIRMLQMKGGERENKKDQKDLRKQIIQVYELFQNEISMHDYNSKPTLEILAAIELYLERQLKNLKIFDPKDVEAQRVLCDKDTKQTQRDEHNRRIKEENEQRIKKNMDKIMQPSKKKVGRQNMFRSRPLEKVEVEQVTEVNNEEEEEKKYFQE